MRVEEGVSPPVEAPELEPSRYLDYLPAIFRQDEFMGRFLLVFESVLGPLEGVVAELPYYCDPSVSPEDMLPYLAHWVALGLDERWPEAQRRRMIRAAAELHRWRGTRRGLRAYVQAITGIAPLVVENTDGSRLGEDNRLGWSTRLGREVPHCVTVTVPVEPGQTVDEAELAELVQAEKPAHTVYVLRTVPRQARPGQEEV
ncbi:MAG: phage tail protein I [Chloroflexi bacterium]|nr:phage tail protein I [Chloroflexota bacterium]